MKENKEDWYSPNKRDGVFGEGYTSEFALKPERTLAEVQAVLKLLPRSPGGEQLKVLDVAGGFGRIGIPLLEKRRDLAIVNLDLNPHLLQLAGAQEGMMRVQADMRQFPLRNHVFDAAMLMFTAFGYFRRQEDDKMVVDEVYRVLKTFGRFILDLPNLDFIRDNFSAKRNLRFEDGSSINYQKKIRGKFLIESRELLVPGKKSQQLSPLRLRVYKSDEIKRMCQQSGFRVELFDETLCKFHSENSRRLWVICHKDAR